jgi:hypothetical protein
MPLITTETIYKAPDGTVFTDAAKANEYAVQCVFKDRLLGLFKAAYKDGEIPEAAHDVIATLAAHIVTSIPEFEGLVQAAKDLHELMSHDGGTATEPKAARTRKRSAAVKLEPPAETPAPVAAVHEAASRPAVVVDPPEPVVEKTAEIHVATVQPLDEEPDDDGTANSNIIPIDSLAATAGATDAEHSPIGVVLPVGKPSTPPPPPNDEDWS